jgi:hypothetical protein
MHVFLLFAVPLAYAYLLTLRDDSGQPSNLTSIAFIRGVAGYLVLLVVLLIMKRFIPRPYTGIGGYLYATFFDYLVPVSGSFGLYLLFTRDVRSMSTSDRELALVSFLAGAMSFAGLMDLVIRPGYMGTYELFLLPAVRVAAVMLIPGLYVLYCDETFWVRYLYLALILLGPALFGVVYALHVASIYVASIGVTAALFIGGWAVAVFASSRGGPARLR